MVNLVRFALSMTMIVAVSIGIARHIGRLSPADFDLLFTNVDGSLCTRPCLFGIRPGDTSMESAVSLLQAHPFTRSFVPGKDNRVFSSGGLSISLAADVNDRLVRIDLNRFSGALSGPEWGSLGRVVASLGSPDAVSNSPDFSAAFYLAGQLTFFHRHRIRDVLSVDDPFEELVVSGKPLENLTQNASWQGFGSLTR